jgi:Spy/CpxP family protein refolding chaperone
MAHPLLRTLVTSKSDTSFHTDNIFERTHAMKVNKTTIGILAVVLTVGIAALAFAHGGYGGGYGMGPGYGGYMMGQGYGGMMGPGYGGPMMGYGSGYGSYNNGSGAWGNNLPEKDAAALNASREKFFNATQDLRNQIEEKQVALNNEMASATPDKGKVIQLQKEISGLQTEFDQKALAHRLEVRRLVPQGFNQSASGRGYGYGGYCWQ